MKRTSKHSPKPSDLLTTGQFAKVVSQHHSTISRWIHEGLIPPEAVSKTITGRFLVKRWAVDEVIR